MKVFAGSPRDLEDARGVLAVSGVRCDKALLRRLVSVYGKREKAALEKLLADKE
jgi:hypothetical protein